MENDDNNNQNHQNNGDSNKEKTSPAVVRRVVIAADNHDDNDVEDGGSAASSKSTKSTSVAGSSEEAAAATDNNNNASSKPRQRRPFVSRHRKALDHIRVDSVEARRHPVPSPIHVRSGGNDGNPSDHDFSGEGDDDDHQLHGDARKSQSDWFAQSTVIKNRVDKYFSKCCGKLSEKKPLDWLDTFLPMCKWLRGYDCKTTFFKDLVAGATVGVMIVPQSMSYAKLAGLPVEYGLYSALMPIFAYSMFGSSRQLAVGPVALISLLLSTGIDGIMSSSGLTEDTDPYNRLYAQLAVQIAFLVGVINITMGLLRMGFVTIFLSHAVISGFTTGAAVIIGMSQVKYIFGYEVERSKKLHEMLQNLFSNIDQFNWKTFVMGVSSVLLLVFMKNIGKTYPRFKFLRALGPLIVTTVTIVLVVLLDLDNRGVPIVDFIPSGLPSVTVDEWFPISNMEKVFMASIGIVIVGFMESIAIAKTLASKHKYEIDSSMELIGLGMANFVGSVFNAYPVTGSFSRSAVNHESGAESGVSGIITATMVGFVLLFMTPVFEKLPLNVLAAIVISGVLGLLDYNEAIHLWKVHKFDFAVWITACFGTMFLGVEMGLAIAVGVSLLIVIYESAYPHTSVLGRLPGTNVYRNVKQYPEAEKYDGIVMVRIDAPIYFANAQNVRDKIRKYRFQAESEFHENSNFEASLKYLVLEMAPVSHVDSSALHVLEDMYKTYKSRGQQMIFVNPSMLVMQRMVDSGFMAMVGRQYFFACLHDALAWCLEDMDQEAMSVHEASGAGDGSLADDSLEEEDDEHVVKDVLADEPSGGWRET